MSNETEKLPSIHPVVGASQEALINSVEQIREIVEVRENRRDNDSGRRFVTVKELIEQGVLPAGYK